MSRIRRLEVFMRIDQNSIRTISGAIEIKVIHRIIISVCEGSRLKNKSNENASVSFLNLKDDFFVKLGGWFSQKCLHVP